MAAYDPSREGGTAFVGRRQELAWLRERLELAGRGYGHFVLVEGDAGVGKTRLVQALLGDVRDADALVIRGRCYEHLDLAYLPLQEGLFATLAQHVSRQPGRDAELELLRRVGGSDGPAADGGTAPIEEERSRQMLELTRLVLDLARDRLVVLFLDDVDWADSATIAFLQHLLFRLDDAPASFLAVLTSRGSHVGRGMAGISRLRGDPRTATLALNHLTSLEATELAREVRPNLGLTDARRLAAIASGNPFLVEALAGQPEAPWLAAAAPPTDHPLLAAIDSALGRLDETTRTLVRVAAFLIPECSRDLLGEVSGLAPRELAGALAEAIDARVLVEDLDRLAFTHPLYPHTLRSEVGPASSRRLHARIAEVLLARQRAGQEATTRAVAHHLVEAGAEADLDIVFEHARVAGQQAMAAAAWEEAARCYDAATRAAPTGLDLHELVALHRLAGLCHRADLDLAGAVDRFEDAIELLGPDGDPSLLTELHIWRIRCAVANPDLLEIARERSALERLVESVGDRRPDLAAEGLVELAQSYWVFGEPARSEVAARRAIEIADRHDDHHSHARATTVLCVPLWARYDLQESLAVLEEGVAHAGAASGGSILAGGPSFRIPLVLCWLGRLDEAETGAHECRALAEKAQYPLEAGLPLGALAQVATARGAFDLTEQYAHQALLIQRIGGYHWAAGLFFPPLVAAHIARGRWGGARAALAAWDDTADPVAKATIGLLERYVDVCERGHAVEAPPLPRLPRTAALGVDTWAAAEIEIARREGAPADLERLYEVLGAIAARGGMITNGLAMLVTRLLGVAADGIGREASAITHFRDAIAVGERLRAEPEVARAQVDLAAILRRRGERREARELVDRAIATFDRCHMLPERHRAELLAGGHAPAAAASGESVTTESVVILFSDVVDSTRTTEELGASRYRALARRVEDLVVSAISAHGGSIVSGINLGDGFIGLFASTARALAAARQCAAEVCTTGLHLHLAIHRGEVIVDGPRIFGGPVNYAARICGLTGPDEILVSETVRHGLADVEDVAFVDRGEHMLKGIEGPQRVWAVMTARDSDR